MTINAGLQALTTDTELAEVRAVNRRREAIKLKRTYNQKTIDPITGDIGIIKFWRVMSETHSNYLSDLSYQGLVEWGVIK